MTTIYGLRTLEETTCTRKLELSGQGEPPYFYLEKLIKEYTSKYSRDNILRITRISPSFTSLLDFLKKVDNFHLFTKELRYIIMMHIGRGQNSMMHIIHIHCTWDSRVKVILKLSIGLEEVIVGNGVCNQCIKYV